MKHLFILACTLCIAVACSNDPTAVINATIEGAADTSVVLQKLNYNKLQPVDTIKTDATGHFNYKVKLKGSAPYFYYIYYGNNQVASLVLLEGDKVTVKASTVGDFSVEGSPESLKFKQLNEMYGKAYNTLDALVKESVGTSASEQKEINKKLGRTYLDYRKEVTKFVMSNPKSISAAVALFQKFNDNLPVFGTYNDVFIFQSVCDSLSTVYPKSEYIAALRDEIARRSNIMSWNEKISNANQLDFPEIAMPDINGEIKLLSDLKGKLVIVSFWSVGQDNYKMFNNELAVLYKKYNSKGLDIYQVSLDIDKSSWAAVIKSQNMPWINVNDGLGIDSPAVAMYNLQGIPSMFLMSRDKGVIATDVFDSGKLEALIQKNL